MTEPTEPSDAERAGLHGFVHVMTETVNAFRRFVPMPALADAMHSAAAEILRECYGAKIAAARLRQAADAFEQINPEESRH
ncbi:MAG: hypothetical protein WD795_18115 [Woeseia sp.]